MAEEATLESQIGELLDQETFPPPEDFVENALVTDDSLHKQAADDFEGFWAEQAEALDWADKWDQVLDWSKPPHAKWFVGGKLNVAYNCVDRHIETARRNKAALIFEGEPGDRRTLTYWDLYLEVNRCANVLKGLGVR